MLDDIVTEDFHLLCCFLTLPTQLSWRGKAFGNGSELVSCGSGGARTEEAPGFRSSDSSQKAGERMRRGEVRVINANRCLVS